MVEDKGGIQSKQKRVRRGSCCAILLLEEWMCVHGTRILK
jgi:hypothetical protein